MITLAENNSSFRSGTGMKVINPNIDTLLIDLWGTIARSDNREPIRSLQQILGYKVSSIDTNDVRSVDPEFLRVCLTLNEKDPVRFAQLVGNHFGVVVTPDMVAAFLKVINDESVYASVFFDAKAALKELKLRGYRLVLASNLWPFPVDRLFREDNLGKYFAKELRACSYVEGVAKPDISFCHRTLDIAGVSADRCLMIGDHLENDILSYRQIGVKTCLVDRSGHYCHQNEHGQFDQKPGECPFVPNDVLHIASMEDLLELLPDRTKGGRIETDLG